MEALIDQIPYGIPALAMLMAIAGLISAIVPDEKLPKWLAAGLNFLATNFGKSKNAKNQ